MQFTNKHEKAVKQYGKQDLTDWFDTLNYLRDKYPLYYDKPTDGLLSPQQVIEKIGQLSTKDTIYVSGVGATSNVGGTFCTT